MSSESAEPAQLTAMIALLSPGLHLSSAFASNGACKSASSCVWDDAVCVCKHDSLQAPSSTRQGRTASANNDTNLIIAVIKNVAWNPYFCMSNLRPSGQTDQSDSIDRMVNHTPNSPSSVAASIVLLAAAGHLLISFVPAPLFKGRTP